MNMLSLSKILSLAIGLLIPHMDLKAESVFTDFRIKLDQVQLLDGPILGGSKIQKDAVKAEVKKSWREILENVTQFSASEQRKIVTAAMSGLDDTEYLKFGLVFLDSLKDGKIDLSAGQLFIMPNQTKEGFLAINYQEPKLSEALRGVRSLFHKEPNYLNFIDSIATGKAKDEYLTFRENIGLKPRPSINDQISVGVTDVDEVKLQFENGARPAPQNADVFGREKVKIGSQEESNKKETEQTRKPSSLPWIIAGVLLVGILFLLLRNFKGKSTS